MTNRAVWPLHRGHRAPSARSHRSCGQGHAEQVPVARSHHRAALKRAVGQQITQSGKHGKQVRVRQSAAGLPAGPDRAFGQEIGEPVTSGLADLLIRPDRLRRYGRDSDRRDSDRRDRGFHATTIEQVFDQIKRDASSAASYMRRYGWVSQ